MTPLPHPMPKVEGDGPVAEGFRMSFDAINQLIAYCQSLTPGRGTNVDVRRGPSGTVLTGKAGAEPATSDTSEARWA